MEFLKDETSLPPQVPDVQVQPVQVRRLVGHLEHLRRTHPLQATSRRLLPRRQGREWIGFDKGSFGVPWSILREREQLQENIYQNFYERRQDAKKHTEESPHKNFLLVARVLAQEFSSILCCAKDRVVAEEDVLEVAEAEFEAVKAVKVEDVKVKAEGDTTVARLFEAIEVIRDRERFVIQGGSK